MKLEAIFLFISMRFEKKIVRNNKELWFS